MAPEYRVVSYKGTAVDAAQLVRFQLSFLVSNSNSSIFSLSLLYPHKHTYIYNTHINTKETLGGGVIGVFLYPFVLELRNQIVLYKSAYAFFKIQN